MSRTHRILPPVEVYPERADCRYRVTRHTTITIVSGPTRPPTPVSRYRVWDAEMGGPLPNAHRYSGAYIDPVLALRAATELERAYLEHLQPA